MRQIKYRAWCPEISEMLCPVSDKAEWTIDDQTGFIAPLIELEKGIWGMVDKYELMQYTGLKDKNDVEVFEGDILEIEHSDWTTCEIEHAEVKWCGSEYPAFDIPESSCSGESNGLSLVSEDSDYTITVIGNIYENPELLEDHHGS